MVKRSTSLISDTQKWLSLFTVLRAINFEQASLWAGHVGVFATGQAETDAPLFSAFHAHHCKDPSPFSSYTHLNNIHVLCVWPLNLVLDISGGADVTAPDYAILGESAQLRCQVSDPGRYLRHGLSQHFFILLFLLRWTSCNAVVVTCWLRWRHRRGWNSGIGSGGSCWWRGYNRTCGGKTECMVM